MPNFTSSPHFHHLLHSLPVAPVVAALGAQPHLFGQHPDRARAPNSPHREATDIWLRYNDYRNLGPTFNDEHDSVWYPAWYALPELAPLVFGLMHEVQGERLGGILITKLPPGGQIARHTDHSWHARYYDKFYIALQNAPGSVFSFPDGDIHAQAGDCYWFDNSVPHSVHNQSGQDRLALIVCIKTDLFKDTPHA
jgi:hypothetical protein